MKKLVKSLIVMVTAAAITCTGTFAFGAASSPIFADVGSASDSADITYDKDGGVLSSIGVDTSVMPEDYDPNSTDNPYGSDTASLNTVNELAVLYRDSQKSQLLGHNAPLDGKYETLEKNPVGNAVPNFSELTSASTAALDLTGSGRKSGLAIVYTDYCAPQYSPEHPENNKIYLMLYNPYNGTASEPIDVSSFVEDRVEKGFMVQSQLQIACGDFDNDTIDEIAVYVPSPDGIQRPKVSVFDLVNGKEAQDPYSASAWQLSWNYVLPITSEPVVEYAGTSGVQYLTNFYNNIDLAAGDADNDGTCDLVISYGASATGAETGAGKVYNKIMRSIESQSVLLYGSNKGQMLKKSQKLSYDDNSLIRVSFAFGDLDDDGNEEMILGGQLKDEQSDNTSRVLGKYTYDPSEGTMIPETIQNMAVVDGTVQEDGTFASANGWDEHYYSTPVMNTNLSVGKFFGSQSNTRIYLDSVLYSYDSVFAIEDELEDISETTDKDGNAIPKGSQALVKLFDILRINQWEYYEYGAKAANFTGGDFDYAVTTLVSKPRGSSEKLLDQTVVSDAALLYVEGEDLDNLKMKSIDRGSHFKEETRNAPFIFAVPDTDVDGTVAEYTGNHKILYDNPKVDAVLASAPYFKDVAAYDNGEMLNWCSTGYGSSDGTDHGIKHSKTVQAGAFVDFDWSWGHVFTDDGGGKCWSWEWGDEITKEFTMSYDTAGGEDAVVLYSIPREYFEYTITGVEVDDDGNTKEFKQTMYITFPHQPVTQTLLLEDYMEIQKEYSDQLPDVTKYFSSTPGDPSSYPKSMNDIPKLAKEYIAKDDHMEDMIYAAEQFAGIAYGSGRVSQSFTVATREEKYEDNEMIGGYGDFNAGFQVGTENVWNLKLGAHCSFDYMEGETHATTHQDEYSCTVANMPVSAKDYGYDFSWKLFEYNVDFRNEKDNTTYSFPIVTYIVNDVLSPPALPDKITQDFDNTTDSQTALTWTYNTGTPQQFEIFKYEDFPQGGGDLPVGTVAGSDYRIKKDENGNTLRDAAGNVVHEYTFIDKDLTADTKYQYRMKVKRSKFPQESIFSPVIEARTDVSQKPDVKLTSNNLKIYPDGVYNLAAVVADPENYEGTINYQWQKYDTKKRIWTDVSGCTKRAISFYKCTKDDAGTYRCRVNLVRKVESHPQYISTYTDTCDVSFSKRSVKFGPISVYKSKGSSPVNTGISVTLSNGSASSVEKPTGMVQFRIEGANAIFLANAQIDEATGIAKIDSLEDGMGTKTLETFTDGGYKVTAIYQGSAIFYAAEDPEDYHYLRNINEALWLSASSSYVFGTDIMQTTGLYDYKKNAGGQVERTDVTDTIKTVVFYAVNQEGKKTGDAVASYTLADTDGKALLPLDVRLAKRGCVEVYTDDPENPAGSAVFNTEKMVTTLSIPDKMTGNGDLLEFYKAEDVTLTGDGSLSEQNIAKGDQKVCLKDLIKFRYYESNGDFICDSTDTAQHKDDFIPADYVVKISCEDPVSTFYKMTTKSADYVIVGNYYKVTAACSDPNKGIVSMLSPDAKTEFEETGYAGGTKLIFKAVPNRGYQVKRWEIDECGTNKIILPASETLTYTVKSRNTSGNGKITITAILEPKANTLFYEAKGNGTVEVTPAIESGSIVVADTDLTFKATPAEGWKFVEWKWVNDGGSNSISKGESAEDGTNTKIFTMTDNSASLFGVFMRETIDLDLQGALNAAYMNDGSNPLEQAGQLIDAGNGQGIPKGTQVIVSTKQGFSLDTDEGWKITVTTPEGTRTLDKSEYTELVSGGQAACKFTLPQDVTACSVSAKTVKGKYSVNASADDVQFVVKVDGARMEGAELFGLDAGSLIEITALPNRGKLLKNWMVNGETMESKETVYTTTITENLSVTAATEDDNALSLKLKTEGGGTAKYVITDKNGEEHTDTFGATEITPDLYQGESLLLGAADDETGYTMTAVSVNGQNQALEGGAFELKDLAEDTAIICRFTPSAYHRVTITDETKESHAVIMDEDEIVLDPGETISVPDGGTAVFKVAIDNSKECHVYNGTAEIAKDSVKEYGDNKNLYTYKIENIKEETELTVTNSRTCYIGTPEELKLFFGGLNQSGPDYTNAVLTADIEMVFGDQNVSAYKGVYKGTFDGKGHTIKGLGTSQSLFERIGEEGCVKDVVLEDPMVGLFETSLLGYAVVTLENYGTISGVLLKNATIHATPNVQLEAYSMAGLAVRNEGTIINCEVSGLHLVTASSPDFPEPIGCAGVIINQQEEEGNAVFRNNYFEGLERGTSGSLQPAKDGAIVAKPDAGVHHGSFENNYILANEECDDPHAKNLVNLASGLEKVGTPAFARHLAWYINDDVRETIWGICSDADTGFMQIQNGVQKGCKAPVEVVFETAKKTETRFEYPGEYKLPDESTFGDATPAAWEQGDLAYAPGSTVSVLKDTKFIGVDEETLKKNYDAKLATTVNSKPSVRYFKNLANALAVATVHNSGAHQELTVLRNCEMKDIDFTNDEATLFRIASGAKLTMKKSASILNQGSIVCDEGSELHKYGAIQNSGTIDISGTLYNYGSKFTGSMDAIEHRENIVCNPHCTGAWKQALKPNEDGTWTKESICSVCGNKVTEELQPNPEAGAVSSLTVLRGPEKELFEIGEEFSDQGLLVAAELINGDKTVVTAYDLTAGGNPLTNGTVLDTEGEMEVTVGYEGHTCSFTIYVDNYPELLRLTDSEGNAISEQELNVGKAFEINASLKRKLPQESGFLWETSDAEIAALGSGTSGKTQIVNAGTPGEATITVTVVDENGVPIEGILPKTVKVSVVDHIRELKILGGDREVNARMTCQLETEVVPANTTDKLVWTSDAPAVASVNSEGLVTAHRGGKAVIKATAPSGISDSCEITVIEKATAFKLSATELPIAAGGFEVLSAEVQPADANGEVLWSVPDDSAAGFFVPDETGTAKVVKETATKLSADGKGTSDSYVVLAGVASGEVTVTASVETADGSLLTQTCAVTVSEQENTIAITNNGVSVAGQTLALDIEGRGIQFGYRSSIENDKVKWSVIDDAESPAIKVSNKGLVTFLKKGTAGLRLTSTETGATSVCLIKVREIASAITLSETSLSLLEGETTKLTAAFYPEGTEGDIRWTSTNEAVATVSVSGTVTAVGEGSAVIKAKIADGVEATCDVEVAKETFTVTFTDGLGTTLDQQTVKKGEDATAPESPKRDHYVFDGWDRDFRNVTENLTVNAKWLYAPEKEKVSIGEPDVKLSATSYIYDGLVHKPTVISIGGMKLKEGKDYTIKWSKESPISVGVYSLTLYGKGEYTGTTKLSFKIRPVGTKIKKVTKAKKGMVVRWARMKKKMASSHISGYQVQIALDKGFKEARKTYTIKGYKKTLKKIGSLKGGKKYYVRVRTYKLHNGAKNYSTWSKVKTVKTGK